VVAYRRIGATTARADGTFSTLEGKLKKIDVAEVRHCTPGRILGYKSASNSAAR
jgi:hypothetical protein